MNAPLLRPLPGRREVPYVNFPAQYAGERDDLHAIFERVFRTGEFVGGSEVEAFERQVAEYLGVRHCVALNSGTDALILGLKAAGVGPGDEVITAPNSFVASAAAIVHVGAQPVFADVLPDQSIDPMAVAAAVGPRTRAIMPVHLTGRVAPMDAIMQVAEKHGLVVIEDAAQAIGSKLDDRMAGAIGHVGCFSTHPLKNLNGAGDGGLLVTSDDAIDARVRRQRSHGMVDRNTVAEWGLVSRMDVLQAAILRYRLKSLPEVIHRRRRNAGRYRELLDTAHVQLPPDRRAEFNTWHTFVIQVDGRDALQARLAERGVGTAIHYPTPIHLQPAARSLGYRRGDFPVAEAQAARILTLPIHQFLTDDDVAFVAAEVNGFFREGA
jgi:dTDP-4-amino-4,6-dideoxygalactose transaminase